MVDLIVYGSLLNRDHLLKYDFKSIHKIKLKGYERHCNHLSVTRRGERRGVFNLEVNKYSWINGLLVKDITYESWKNIIYRERGYGVNELVSDKIRFYSPESVEFEDPKIFIGNKSRENISSSIDYLSTCIKGARGFDDEFFKDFLRSSYVYEKGSKKLLKNKFSNGDYLVNILNNYGMYSDF